MTRGDGAVAHDPRPPPTARAAAPARRPRAGRWGRERHGEWVAFGGGGVIAENDRAAQRKVVKFNHLLSNCLLFSTVALMSRALTDLRAEGYPIEADAVAALSPYMTTHLKRFGRYSLDP